MSEELLLRDLIFVLQGVDGQFVVANHHDDCFSISSEASVSAPQRILVQQIAELGWLHNKVSLYVNKKLKDATAGLMEQSFCGSLQKQLADYYRMIS